MPRSRYRFVEQKGCYFITCSVIGWTPLFKFPWLAEIVLDQLRVRQRMGGFVIHAYVLMEDHLHAILSSDDASAQVAALKSFTGRLLIDAMHHRRQHEILSQLRWHMPKHRREKQSAAVWQEGSHPQIIDTDEMLAQKIDYIHNNPVGRGYVAAPEHWRYSSAGIYVGQSGLLPVTLQVV